MSYIVKAIQYLLTVLTQTNLVTSENYGLERETVESLTLRNPKFVDFLNLAAPNLEIGQEGFKKAQEQMQDYYKRIAEYASTIDIQQINLDGKLIFAKHAINNEGEIKITVHLRNYDDALGRFERYFGNKIGKRWGSETSPRYSDVSLEMGMLLTFFEESDRTFNTYFYFGEKYGTPIERLKQLIEALGGSENIEKIKIKG